MNKSFKKITGIVHRWLGLSSGLVVFFLGITGCLLAFQREIETVTKPYQYTPVTAAPVLEPSQLKAIAEKALPGKHPHSIAYEKGKAARAVFYGEGYYDLVYMNPYTGAVQQVSNMNRDFFRILIVGHYQLWLPVQIGQPIVSIATLIFVVLMISGLILWWPKNKAARKQRLSFKWTSTVRWKRKNYDLHNILGFYMTWIAIFIAITGLVMGFQWFARSVYFVTSGGRQMQPYYEAVSARPVLPHGPEYHAADAVFHKGQALYSGREGSLEVHFPGNDSTAIELAFNPDPATYWKADYRYFDQHTLQEIPVTHPYGRLANTSVADKIARMNYDVHVGAVGGIVTKLLAFFASLIAASLPVTGFLIWRGRKNKKPAGK